MKEEWNKEEEGRCNWVCEKKILKQTALSILKTEDRPVKVKTGRYRYVKVKTGKYKDR